MASSVVICHSVGSHAPNQLQSEIAQKAWVWYETECVGTWFVSGFPVRTRENSPEVIIIPHLSTISSLLQLEQELRRQRI